jgi:rRNA maturation endonuclease Nob1
MALIPCYECEKEISDQAPACPHCGSGLRRDIEKDSGWVHTLRLNFEI